MSFQQLIAGKVKLNGLAGIQHHLIDRDRVKTNPNIDLSRSKLNYSIEDLSPEHLIHRVKQRIKQLNLKKRPRSDAVGIEDIIVSASADFMLSLDAQTREQYFKDALYFFQRRYGKENVMYCHCHLDESNPHVHIGIVPITKDDRLSAKSLFSPKTLEQLQTDFNRDVAQHYGLQRGEHHAKKYLPLQQFKAHQAKQQAQQFSDDLDSAVLTQTNIDEIQQAVHFATNAFFFKDKENVELPTKHFLTLKSITEQAVKAFIHSQLIQEENLQLKHENQIIKSSYDFIQNRFDLLTKKTQLYTDVPEQWREHIDSSILDWQKHFSAYCHDVNRAILRVFLATHGNHEKTKHIMSDFIEKVGTYNTDIYIDNVIRSASRQHSHNLHPTTPPPAWKHPKPSDTDYSKPDELSVVPLQLSHVPDIDWNLINWELLSELDKDEIKNKIKVYSR